MSSKRRAFGFKSILGVKSGTLCLMVVVFSLVPGCGGGVEPFGSFPDT